MRFGNYNKFLSITLALIIALVSALSAAHLNAHQTPDTVSIEDCLALHATALDSAIDEIEYLGSVEPRLTQKIQILAYFPVIGNFFRLKPRGPPVLS